VAASTAAARAEADVADRTSGLTHRTNGWRLRQPFFFSNLGFTEALQPKCA